MICKLLYDGHWFALFDRIGLKHCLLCGRVEDIQFADDTIVLGIFMHTCSDCGYDLDSMTNHEHVLIHKELFGDGND